MISIRQIVMSKHENRQGSFHNIILNKISHCIAKAKWQPINYLSNENADAN